MTVLYEQWEPHARRLAPLLGPDVSVAATVEELMVMVNNDPAETLVVFGPGTSLADTVDFAEQCRRHRPRLGVVLLRRRVADAVTAEALQAGVREVVDAADTPAIQAACARPREGAEQTNGWAGRHRPEFETAGPAPAPAAPVLPAAPVMPAPVVRAPEAPVPTQELVPVLVQPAVAQWRPAPVGGRAPGRLTAVFAAKGGCGKTTVATNVAVALASDGAARVCLIDLDLACGDVAIMLQLAPNRTIADAVAIAERIDSTGLRTLLTPHASGVEVLLAPIGPAVAEEIKQNLVRNVLHLARAMFDHVVVDCASQFSETVLAVLDEADQYVLVTTPELPALRSLRVTLDMFDLLGYGHDGRVVVLNRADSKVGLSPGAVERVLRVPVTAQIPSSRDVPVCANRGVPITVERPTHAVSAAFRSLASKHLAHGNRAPARGLRRLVPRRATSGAMGRGTT